MEGRSRRGFRDLDVYQLAMATAIEVQKLTRDFPKAEQYAIVDQMRRSARSVCANIAESWYKRRYKAAFIAKISDAQSEAGEMQVWVEMAWRCGYISEDAYSELDDR